MRVLVPSPPQRTLTPRALATAWAYNIYVLSVRLIRCCAGLIQLDINLESRLVTLQSVLSHASLSQLRAWVSRAVAINDTGVVDAWNAATARLFEGVPSLDGSLSACVPATVVTALPAGHMTVGTMLDPVTPEAAKRRHIVRKALLGKLVEDILDEHLGEAMPSSAGTATWASASFYAGSNFEHPEGGNLTLDHLPE